MSGAGSNNMNYQQQQMLNQQIYYNNMLAFLIQNMVIPDALIQASKGSNVGVTARD
jgi:hypothetical protein